MVSCCAGGAGPPPSTAVWNWGGTPAAERVLGWFAPGWHLGDGGVNGDGNGGVNSGVHTDGGVNGREGVRLFGAWLALEGEARDEGGESKGSREGSVRGEGEGGLSSGARLFKGASARARTTCIYYYWCSHRAPSHTHIPYRTEVRAPGRV